MNPVNQDAKTISTCRLQYGGHFVSVSVCYGLKGVLSSWPSWHRDDESVITACHGERRCDHCHLVDHCRIPLIYARQWPTLDRHYGGGGETPVKSQLWCRSGITNHWNSTPKYPVKQVSSNFLGNNSGDKNNGLSSKRKKDAPVNGWTMNAWAAFSYACAYTNMCEYLHNPTTYYGWDNSLSI